MLILLNPSVDEDFFHYLKYFFHASPKTLYSPGFSSTSVAASPQCPSLDVPPVGDVPRLRLFLLNSIFLYLPFGRVYALS
jgi:hypothetical protein